MHRVRLHAGGRRVGVPPDPLRLYAVRAWLAQSWPQGACGSVVGLAHPAAILVKQTQHKIEMDARDKSPGAIPPPMPGMVRLAAVVAS